MKNTSKNNRNMFFAGLAFLFILTAIPAYSFSQTKIPGNKGKLKGKGNSYITYDQGEFIVVSNKKNELMYQYSVFDEYRNLSSFIKTDYRHYVDSLVVKCIAQSPRKNIITQNPENEGISTLGYALFAKTDGKVCEVLFSYHENSGITVDELECIENAILNADLRLNLTLTM